MSAINLIIGDETLDFLPMFDGFDHPAMWNPYFCSNDESSSKGKLLYYSIHKGWVHDIADTYASAWDQAADYQQFTKYSAYHHGIPLECKGFNSYKESIT